MIRCSFFMLYFFLPILSYAQIADYRSYQESINKAEIFLVHGKKEQALDIYYNTLLKTDGNFVKDIYNSLLLANDLVKIDTFFTLLYLLPPKGLSQEVVNGETEFEHLHDDPRWSDFVKKNNDYSNLDFKAIKKIDELEKADQYYRLKRGSYQVYGDTIRIIDSLNMEFILELVQTHQFPGEREIGARDFYGTQGYDIVLHHYTQSTSKIKDKKKITPMLINLVVAGIIPPNKCGLWLDMQKGEMLVGAFSLVGLKLVAGETKYYTTSYSKTERLLIEQYRKLLGMEPLEEYHEKIKYVLNNPESGYKFDVQIGTYEVSEDMYQRLSKKMTPLD